MTEPYVPSADDEDNRGGDDNSDTSGTESDNLSSDDENTKEVANGQVLITSFQSHRIT